MSNFLSLKDHVYNYISGIIASGKLKSDEKINEKNIMDELQISRTPVREALIQLASEGYIENVPRKGFIVKNIDESKVAEIYALLGVLDGFTASLSCTKLDDKDYRKMDMLIFGMTKAIEEEDYSDYYKLQTDFHDTYTCKCGNEELISTIHRLKKFFIRQSYHKDRSEIQKLLFSAVEEHKVILQLFRDQKTAELDEYLKNVHWSVEYARLDSIK